MNPENEHEDIDQSQTGGLKLMTVFIVVLALHVVVIGAISAYHYFGKGGADALAAKEPATGETFEGDYAGDAEPVSEPAGHSMAETTPEERVYTPTDPEVVSPRDILAVRLKTPSEPPTEAATETAAAASAQPHSQPAPVASAPQPVPAPAPAAAEAPVHVVQKGDTLYRIAKQHGTSVGKLKAANGLQTDMLKIGQKLKLPAAAQVASASAPAATKTPEPAAAHDPTVVYGETTAAPKEKEPAATSTAAAAPATPAAKPAPASTGEATYTVAKGDTLWRIAKRFKTTPDALMAANGISDPAKLRIGASLRIPSQGIQQADAKPQTKGLAAPPARSSDIVLAH